MATTGDISAALETVYESAWNDALWPDALRRIAGLSGGTAAALVVQDLQRRSILSFQSWGVDPIAWDSYDRHFVQTDLWRDGSAGLPSGDVKSGDELVPRERFLRSPWYNDFLRPLDIGQLLGCVMRNDRRVLTAVSIYRPLRASEPSGQERRALADLAAHVERAQRIAEERNRSALLDGAKEQALQALAVGAVLFDSSGRIIWLNRAAEQILAEDDGLRAARHGFAAADPLAERQLRAALHEAGRRYADDTARFGSDLLVFRPSGRRPYRISVVPLFPRFRERQFPGQPSPAAMAWLWDPERRRSDEAAWLSQRFGLTAAEARVATAIAAGRTPLEISAEEGVAPSTVRSHLKQAFEKTDTHRQSELALLVATEQAPLRLHR